MAWGLWSFYSEKNGLMRKLWWLKRLKPVPSFSSLGIWGLRKFVKRGAAPFIRIRCTSCNIQAQNKSYPSLKINEKPFIICLCQCRQGTKSSIPILPWNDIIRISPEIERKNQQETFQMASHLWYKNGITMENYMLNNWCSSFILYKHSRWSRSNL